VAWTTRAFGGRHWIGTTSGVGLRSADTEHLRTTASSPSRPFGGDALVVSAAGLSSPQPAKAAAQATALAAKEGGFLGFNAERVSEGEQQMLETLGGIFDPDGAAAAGDPPPA